MTEFKTGTQSKKDREKHDGIVFSVVEKDDHSIDYIVLKESDGNHIYYPAKGKVAQYLQPIQPGEHITFEALTEKDGNKTIVWVLAWERVHTAVHSAGDAKKVADTIVSSGQGKERTLERTPDKPKIVHSAQVTIRKADGNGEAEEERNPPAGDPTPEEIKRVREYLEKQGEVFAGQLSEPKSKVPSFLTDGQKKERRIGYYSNLNTAVEIVKIATEGLDKASRKDMNVPTTTNAVLQVAKQLHDWVEERIGE